MCIFGAFLATAIYIKNSMYLIDSTYFPSNNLCTVLT